MSGGATEDGEGRQGEFVQSLERGLAVIRAFGAGHPAMTLSEVAREAGLSRASARRFLHTLVELGYVATDGRSFALRPRALELGYAYLSGLTLPEVAQPHLEALSEQVGESTSVAVLDGADVVYVARVATRRIMSAAIQVGTRFPAYATSMGRAVLSARDDEVRDDLLARTELLPLTPWTLTSPDALRAELARVREQGYAFVDQELEEGLRSLAVAVRGADGEAVAAVNVSAPVRRGDVDTLIAEILPPLRATAAEIEADFQRVP
ncbi:IclR family transcriptional regulator domain-containing protein [Myceligenerans xiligouense]|uniref:Glycerol operon regulatory protein n=1 Tax=Myceligenerans xiligouense TaxID=253184 RepID=A0A3N4YMF4_9MICO|nr:IclR family transcriptional regulator C-terminal domain-containing protein [Myceligenerans xiligouense]RPF19620.1 IclR family transcriptional regulator [Myceligenerans xiligouense]